MSTEGWDTDPGVIRAQEIQAETKLRQEVKTAVLDELHRAVCLIGIITDRDGHDLIRRDSVLDIIDQRRFRR